jgi:exodeoxyribonuclease VII large subunit
MPVFPPNQMETYPQVPATMAVLTVGELVRSAKRVLEQSFPLAWIAGEISNLTQAASGHLYFTLKDREAQVRCVMFRNRFSLLDWIPLNGVQVEVRALVTMYEARGEFQLNIESMRRAGLGALYEAFARLKQKLEAEGLFAAARKRPLPRFPRRVGIVSSTAAAALRDVLTTLHRRNPRVPVVIYPAQVQGPGAGAQLAAAIAIANRRAECDVLILCRGGGSIEDLWAFNDESLARAIAASVIPVVSGVGHETDFTIADFVADLRAPTPTAAAATAVPDRRELGAELAGLARHLDHTLRAALLARAQRVDQASLRLLHPGARIDEQSRSLLQLKRRLDLAQSSRARGLAARTDAIGARLARDAPQTGPLSLAVNRAMASLQQALRNAMRSREARAAHLAANLAHLDPAAVLKRGYSLVRDSSGRLVRSSAALATGDAVNIGFAQGWADAEVTRRGD